MKKILSLPTFLLLSFLCSLTIIGFSQNKIPTNTISLKSGTIYLQENANVIRDSLMAANLEDKLQLIIQFHDLPDASTRQLLKTHDVLLMDYVSNRSYIAFVSASSLPNLPMAAIRSITPMQPEWKMDERVQKLLLLSSIKTFQIAVSFTKNITADEIKKILTKHEATPINKKFNAQSIYEINIKNTSLIQLASEANVRYLSIVAKDVTLNYDDRAATGAEIVQLPTSQGGLGLDGTGVTVGVGDNSTPIFHTDTRDRVTNFNPDPPELHGQHVAGTITSKGIIDPKGKGMAPNVNVLSHLYNIVLEKSKPMFEDYNMTLSNNSYAAIVNDCSVAGTYDLYSQLLDDNSHSLPEVLNVFAAGNDGNKDCSPYPVGFGTVVGVYQTAKNVLTVSSMRKPYTVHEGASKGPVKDGRIKPEVVSFGAGVFSTALYDGYIAINGTSMACPGATGALALLTQRYKQLNGNNNPHNALLKALIINGAVDVGNAGPDYINGFGLINIYKSLNILNNNQFSTQTITNSATQTSTIAVPTNTAQLKVLLYWNDTSASPAASSTLVNNLDLTVTEPNNTVHRPLILDPTPANVTNLATEAVDNINNVEQVIINNPQQGNYNVTISGTSIPTFSQDYYLVYDFIQKGITIKYPTTNMNVPANEAITIFWDASDDPNLLTIEYSDNNGASWNTIANNVPSNQKYYNWNVPNITTSQALIRITRNTTSIQAISGQFVINPQPVLQLSTTQCPGYFSFNWNAIPNAGSYQILHKIGNDLQAIDTVTATNYVIKGLPLHQTQYVAVAPIINSKLGFRSKALTRLPNDGNCAGSISDNDLTLDSISNFKSGRKFTSTELTNSESMTIVVRNLDDVANNNYKISYQINGGTWQSQTFTTPIPANSTASVSIANIDVSSVGTYQFNVAIENQTAPDPVKSNDTISFTIKQLANDPVDIVNVYSDDFESSNQATYTTDEIGLLPGDHWDYENSTDSGRLRTFVANDISIGGQRSISMDLLYSLTDNRNYLYGTFNLGNHNVATTEARLEFDYKLHGTPKFQDGNDVYVRGNDTQPWIKLFDIDTNISEGVTTKTGSLSITNALTNASQDFSTSFQVRVGQHDTSAIAANEYGNGLTIDNFRLYNVKNDVQLLSIINPTKFNCGLSQNEFVTLSVYNSDNLPQSNVQLFYRYNNGAIVVDTLTTLAPKDTVDFTFQQPVNISSIGDHVLDVWLVATGDTYLPNDSILNFRFRNQPIINAYPSLDNFETGDGFWYTDGTRSSWQYGTPASPKINKAASGTKAWKTNLSGNYNNMETSYLYSPCYDLSTTTNPMLSFSMATDIENCGATICDKAYLEYSEDGINWIKLGKNDSGTNWYNEPTAQIWNEQDNTRWRVASYLLPKLSSIKLRFVFQSDPGSTHEGIAIDDIHIFDLKNPIYDDRTTNSATAIVQNQEDLLINNAVVGQLFTNGQMLGETNMTSYFHSNASNSLFNLYYIPRSYTVHSTNNPSNEITARLYITDAEVLKMIEDNSCIGCNKAEDAYRLGIVKYDDPNNANENGAWFDNVNGTYNFIASPSINWVPYERGYYAEFKVNSFSEFWFTTEVPDRKVAAVTIFPNPTTDNKLNIAWMGKPDEKLEVVIYDVIGKKIFNASFLSTDSDNVTTLLLPQLAKGAYVLKYKIGSQQGQIKFASFTH